MLRDVMNSYRSWRRRNRTQRELARLDPRLRADIGLPTHADPSLIGTGWLAKPRDHS
jgi:Domain of unknown function (DUF1127)